MSAREKGVRLGQRKVATGRRAAAVRGCAVCVGDERVAPWLHVTDCTSHEKVRLDAGPEPTGRRDMAGKAARGVDARVQRGWEKEDRGTG